MIPVYQYHATYEGLRTHPQQAGMFGSNLEEQIAKVPTRSAGERLMGYDFFFYG